jgi:Fe-S-cluster-containing dehydrogenase component/Ni/Fe-hydrogenase subunit HybB-like protein
MIPIRDGFASGNQGVALQLGFVIDHSRCIGCHACTVACKSENEVPLGSFRTWVKYTERGEFPEVRRSFAVLRCNQCSHAPCVGICPVNALHKRPDGIVDIDPARCIGCKSCLQACPYDALYINDASGTAQKCHFCAHRVERGLAPACAVVCPTEAIIPGDFHDPESSVSRMKAEHPLQARKGEAGTAPNVLYREVGDAGIDPLVTSGATGYMWAERLPGPQLDAEEYEAIEHRATARTVYDVSHPPAWGGRITAYLFTKALSAGALMAGLLVLPPLSLGGGDGRPLALMTAGISMLFLMITTVLLVLDLKRPERFLYILRYPNWGSWLTRGTIILAAFGLSGTAWLAAAAVGSDLSGPAGFLLAAATAPAAVLTASYTAWLFRQAWGRVLWMRRGLAFSFALHAFVAGAALLLIVGPLVELLPGPRGVLRVSLVVGLLAQLVLTLAENRLAPRGREREYARVHRLVVHGPYARRHWALGIGLGTIAPLLLLGFVGAELGELPAAWLALAGVLIEQDVLVRAGQALPIS